MPILGTLLVTLFGALAEFFGLWMAKRVAIATAAITAFLALLTVLGAALSGLAAGVLYALPADSAFATGLYFAIPTNGPACMAIWLAVDAACGAYRIGIFQVRTALAA